VQPDYNAATGRVEIDADTTTTIVMETTVPLGLQTCSDLAFYYDHALNNVPVSDCQAYFKEGKYEHNLTLSVKPTPGCITYRSLMEFKPYNKPGNSMWQGYVPSNITVRL